MAKHGNRQPDQHLHLAGRERSDPAGAGGYRLVAPLDRLPGKRGRAVDERRFGGQPRRVRGGARTGRPPRAGDRVHERPEPQRAGSGGPDCRRAAGVRTHGAERRALPAGRGCACARGGRRPCRGIHADCGVRQRGRRQHGGHRSAGRDGGLLRSRRHLAARRRGIRRLRGRDRARSAAPGRDRARRFGGDGRTQMVLPAVRSGLPAGQGCRHTRERLRGAARHAAGHDLGRESPQRVGPRPAIEPFVPRIEDLDVGADLRHGRVPAGRVAGHGARSPRRGTHPEEPPAGAAEPRVTGDRVLSDQSRRRRSRRAGPGKYEPDRARPRLLGRPRVHVVDAAPQDVFPPALHRQPHHDVG